MVKPLNILSPLEPVNTSSQFSEKHLSQSLFLIKSRPEACNFSKKETLAQVFSCEFCEISKNTFFTEHLWATASEYAEISGSLNFPLELSTLPGAKFFKIPQQTSNFSRSSTPSFDKLIVARLQINRKMKIVKFLRLIFHSSRVSMNFVSQVPVTYKSVSYNERV